MLDETTKFGLPIVPGINIGKVEFVEPERNADRAIFRSATCGKYAGSCRRRYGIVTAAKIKLLQSNDGNTAANEEQDHERNYRIMDA